MADAEEEVPAPPQEEEAGAAEDASTVEAEPAAEETADGGEY